MTQITGKIYQQTNAAGTENRFPRTVMEAVLGLNSHLQAQFGALADIYMPIEGISENKPNQEFVFRKTPNTIKAKALTLDKIKGKTLAWNQLATSFSYSGGGIEVTTQSNGRYKINGTATGTFDIFNFAGLGMGLTGKLPGHKLLLKFVPFSGSAPEGFTIFDGYTGVGVNAQVPSRIITLGENYTIEVFPHEGDVFDNYVFSLNCTDLTRLYGSDIDGMTDAQILAKYESEYGGFHPFNDGELISNDAESLETVGFNQWDEEWERGSYNLDTGETSTYVNNFRSKNPVKVVAGVYYMKTPYNSYVLSYDAEGNYLGYSFISANGDTFTPKVGAAYIHFTVGAEGADYNHDICVNISDPAKNGQYEPYKKSVCPLNIKTRTGKLNGQGASVVVFPDGMNGVGTSFDEANRTKGTKRRARVNLGTLNWSMENYGSFNRFGANFTDGKQGQSLVSEAQAITPLYVASRYVSDSPEAASDKTFNLVYDRIMILDNSYSDAASFKAAMDGVYLDYELTVPQEYVWDEPMPMSTNAGITESRISPNADGISAPMCCDITYGMGATEYAETAGVASFALNTQYAEVAARLLTPRTIWGQVFDGSANVSGAMSGVTNIDSILNFDITNSRIGIGTTTPSYSLDVAGTFHASGNSEIGGNLSVLGEVIVPQYAGLNFGGASDVWLASLGIDQYGSSLILSFGADDDHVVLHDGNYGAYMIPLSEGIASNSARLDSMEEWLSNPRLASLTADRLDSDEISVGAITATSLACAALSGVGNVNSKIYFSGANVGIAQSSPSYGLDVSGTFRATGNSVIGGTLGVTGKLTGYTAEFESVKPSPTEYDSEHSINIPLWRLEEDGEAEFGKTYIRGALKLRAYYEGDFYDASLIYDQSNDVVTCDKPFSAPTLTQTSDARLKTDLSPIALTVEQIASAPAVEFNWVGNGQRGAGSIAQYWEEQLPYNVHRNGDLLTMEYGNIALLSVITCAREIQKLEKRIEELEEKLNS